MKSIRIILFISFIIVFSCTEKTEKTGYFKIKFEHYVDGKVIEFDTMKYQNAAENPYEISEIMYFISRIKLYNHNGKVVELRPDNPFYYVNTNMPKTIVPESIEEVPEGTYDSITFIFGLTAVDNISNRFVNPPETNMAWPEVLGGGYHYMMMNGFYKDTEGNRKTNNFHLGTGFTINGTDTTFIDNSFTVKPEGQSFNISWGSVTTATLVMNIESWFETPYVYDFNHFGGAIMQNQAAMSTACANGKDAFSVEFQ